jgi:translocation protein SEC63
MLSQAPELIEGMIEISYQRKWLETTFSAIKFSQCIIQGLWYTDHPLLQIPHVTENEIKIISKSVKDPSKCLPEFLRTPNAEKKGLTALTDDQRNDIYKACEILPQMKIETHLFVEEIEPDVDDEDNSTLPEDIIDNGNKIFEQDFVTLRVTLTRENTPEGKECPLFPKTLRENWWLILTDKPNKTPKKPQAESGIHAVEKISDTNRKIVHELRFMAPPRAGKYEMDLHVYSDCYMGLDESIEISFEVHPAAELPEYVPHQEDLDLDNEPTLFEQVMAANIDDSSDEDEPNKNTEPNKKKETTTDDDSDGE